MENKHKYHKALLSVKDDSDLSEMEKSNLYSILIQQLLTSETEEETVVEETETETTSEAKPKKKKRQTNSLQDYIEEHEDRTFGVMNYLAKAPKFQWNLDEKPDNKWVKVGRISERIWESNVETREAMLELDSHKIAKEGRFKNVYIPKNMIHEYTTKIPSMEVEEAEGEFVEY